MKCYVFFLSMIVSTSAFSKVQEVENGDLQSALREMVMWDMKLKQMYEFVGTPRIKIVYDQMVNPPSPRMAPLSRSHIKSVLATIESKKSENPDMVNQRKGQIDAVKSYINDVDKWLKSLGGKGRLESMFNEAKEAIDEEDFNTIKKDINMSLELLALVDVNSGLVQKYKSDCVNLSFSKKATSNVNKFRKTTEELPEPVQHDGELEKSMVDAINSLKLPGIDMKGAILTEKEWVFYDHNNGTKDRRMDAWVTGVTDDGECFVQFFTFIQMYTGSGFGETQRYGSGQRLFYDCKLNEN